MDTARVVSEKGEMLGVLSIDAALDIAAEKGLDLVEVTPNATPPVCKIIDYGKYKYEIQKKKNDARKNQKKIDTKEIKMRPNIASGDYDIKLKNARRFIEDANRVRISVNFRGREISHDQAGFELISKFQSDMGDVAKAEFGPKREGRSIVIMMTPAAK